MWLCSFGIHVEFHVEKVPKSHAYITRVVFRFVEADVKEHFVDGLDGLRKIDAYISQLPLLQLVILETNAPTIHSDVAAAVLTEVGECRVQQRTCENAHRLAIKAKHAAQKAPARWSQNAQETSLSPFWYLRRHAGEWADW